MTADLKNSKEELTNLQEKVKELEEEIARLKKQLGQQTEAAQQAAQESVQAAAIQEAVQEVVPAEVSQAPQSSQENVEQQAPIGQEEAPGDNPAEQVAPPVQQEVQVEEAETSSVQPVQQDAQESASLDNDHDGNVDATIILSGVNFTVGTADLTAEAAASLRTTAGLLEKHASGQRFEVAGYTDSMGSPRRNQQISEQRAETVRNFLIRQGIKADLLISKGYGQDNPIADNETRAGRAMNRRVELHQLTAE
jgi:outer membrane protein OmpA-like peptidoglycan-associated protein